MISQIVEYSSKQTNEGVRGIVRYERERQRERERKRRKERKGDKSAEQISKVEKETVLA